MPAGNKYSRIYLTVGINQESLHRGMYQLDNFAEGLVRWLGREHQTSDKLVRAPTACTKQDCALLSRFLNAIGLCLDQLKGSTVPIGTAISVFQFTSSPM